MNFFKKLRGRKKEKDQYGLAQIESQQEPGSTNYEVKKIDGKIEVKNNNQTYTFQKQRIPVSNTSNFYYWKSNELPSYMVIEKGQIEEISNLIKSLQSKVGTIPIPGWNKDAEAEVLWDKIDKDKKKIQVLLDIFNTPWIPDNKKFYLDKLKDLQSQTLENFSPKLTPDQIKMLTPIMNELNSQSGGKKAMRLPKAAKIAALVGTFLPKTNLSAKAQKKPASVHTTPTASKSTLARSRRTSSNTRNIK